MVIIVYALNQKFVNVSTVGLEARKALNKENMGRPHYSYQFVLGTFRPLLERIGCVVDVSSPEEEVDAIYAICEHENEPCVFLSFTPPQWTCLSLECPTIPVFAWEFADIPTEQWRGERDDWRVVFSNVHKAITHSGFAAQAVRREMGEDYPILPCPAPVYDKFENHARPDDYLSPRQVVLSREAFVVDVRTPGKKGVGTRGSVVASAVVDIHEMLHQHGMKPVRRLSLDGVVYLATLNPQDGRKNWKKILIDFWRVFRDTPDATLVFKFIHSDTRTCVSDLEEAVYQVAPFNCRIVCVTGYLEQDCYASLIASSTYAVNASVGEGQCLPLMESMSSGVPVLSPRHTAMSDYVDPDNAFIIDTYLDAAVWPQDSRGKFRTVSHRVIDDSLMDAYRRSYDVAVNDSPRYLEMCRSARRAMRRHCSDEEIENRLRGFLTAHG